MWPVSTLVCLNLFAIATSHANLEGPFAFWGPRRLTSFKRPALVPLGQDELLEIYDGPRAIVVFNVQDSPRALSSDDYPRLSRLLERRAHLFAPQDFLDVHPEYVNNETQVIAVQGPPSERDAEITEKFERLEDVYGEGNVLAILGCSNIGPVDEEPGRSKRQADAEEEPKEAPEEVVYHVPGKALFYTADFPILRLAASENASEKVYKLRNPITVSTDDRRDQFTKLTVTFSNLKEKIQMTFKFPEVSGHWSIDPVEVTFPGTAGVPPLTFTLAPPKMEASLGAPKGFSFTCGSLLTFYGDGASLTFDEIQVQPFLAGANRFGPSYNCIDTMTIPIWSGLFVSAILLAGVTIALNMILEIKVMDRFENSKGKTLTISVTD